MMRFWALPPLLEWHEESVSQETPSALKVYQDASEPFQGPNMRMQKAYITGKFQSFRDGVDMYLRLR
jgi:hypothetical protein